MDDIEGHRSAMKRPLCHQAGIFMIFDKSGELGIRSTQYPAPYFRQNEIKINELIFWTQWKGIKLISGI